MRGVHSLLIGGLIGLSLSSPCAYGQDAVRHTKIDADAIVASGDVDPRDAVVLDPNYIFSISTCAMGSHTDYAWTTTVDGHPRFVTAWPGRRHVWTCFNFLPVDPQVYPIMVMTYRTRGTVQRTFWDYHVYFSDDRAAGRGGIRPDNPAFEQPLVADGELYEHRVDLRNVGVGKENEMGVFQGNLTSIWVGARAGLDGPGEFDLIGLRMEATDETRPAAGYGEGEPMRLRVTDPAGRPVEGAAVTVDAQRLNFARGAETDRFGYVTVTPMDNEVGKHMARVVKDGWVTSEFYDLRVGQDGAVPLVVEKAVVYRGQIVDARGAGIENVAVRMYPAGSRGVSNLARTTTQLAVATGPDGRWESPPMPASIEALCLRFTHPDYVSDTHAELKTGHDPAQLVREYPVHVMPDGRRIQGRIIPAAGKTLDGVQTFLQMRNIPEKLAGWVYPDGHFQHGVVPSGPGQLIIQSPDHQDMTIDFDEIAEATDFRIELLAK